MGIRILSGQWKGRTLASPRGDQTRPTTSQLRQAVFNIWADRVSGSTLLDLFAGTGAIALEALSLGAASAVLVESHPQAVRSALESIEQLGCGPRVRVRRQSVESYLQSCHERFDLIYADPPYGWGGLSGKRAGHYVGELAQALAQLLRPGGQMIIEQDRHCQEPLSGLVGGCELLETRTYGDSRIHRFGCSCSA